jgi:predicted PurR-regulated permease PerM
MNGQPSHLRRNIALAVLAGLVLWFAWSVRSALNPLLIGFLLAFILHPMVLSLERRGWSRGTAVNVIFVGAGLVATLLALAVFFQARELWSDVFVNHGALKTIESQVSSAVEQVSDFLRRWGIEVPAAAPVVTPPANSGEAAAAKGALDLESLADQIREWLASDEGRAGVSQAGLRVAGGAWAFIGSLFGSVIGVATFLLLVPMYTWFLLFELERITSFINSYIPLDYRTQVTSIARQIGEMLGKFFRGRLLVCLLKGLLLTLMLFACGVSYPLLLGLSAGFLSLLPFAGPGIGYAFMFLISLLDHTWGEALWRVALVGVIGEVVEGYVLMPKVLGKSMGLHSVVVLASFMIFGSALGMFGLLLALPLMSVVVIVARELVLPALRELAEARGAKKA